MSATVTEPETALLEGSPENPMLGRSRDGYYDTVSYTAEVRDDELTPQIKKVLQDISELEKQKKRLVDSLAAKSKRPAEWGVEVEKIYDYGTIVVRISKRVWKEKPTPLPQSAAAPPKELTPLQKVLGIIDAKTLLNSGVLTKDEKRSILGLPELSKRKEAA